MEQERKVQCGAHGLQTATFVCQHIVRSLQTGVACGFWCAADSEDLRPDAWCTACEQQVQATGGEWNDQSEGFAKVSLMCGACYDRAKAMNHV